MRKNLSVADLGNLLDLPILAVLATQRRDGSTLLSPVWHEWNDGGFLITTWANDIKSKGIKRNPRITVLVAEEQAPYRGIEVNGEATIEPLPDHMPTIVRLASRYLGDDVGPQYAEKFRDQPLELIRLKPGALRTWDFNEPE